MVSASSNPLVGLYTRRIGIPSTSDEVYGYWLFVAGLFTAFVGIAIVLPTETSDPLRGAGIAIASVGLVLLLIGPIIRLPLRRAATFVASFGSLVAVLAVVWFIVEFNAGNWAADFSNNEPFVIALYGVGILLIAVGGVITPLVTSPREQQRIAERRAVEAESERDQAVQKAEQAIKESERAVQKAQQESDRAAKAAQTAADERARRLVREQERQRIRDSQSQFELYTDRAGEHRWRLRHRNRNIIADSGEGYASRQKVQQGLTAVKRDAFGAALIDLDVEDSNIEAVDDAVDGEDAPAFVTAAESLATFETYTDDDRHHWRLRHDNGDILADGVQGYSDAETRDNTIEDVRHYAQTADYLRIDPAAFELYRDQTDTVGWRLLHKNGTVIADASQAYDSRRQARQSIANVQQSATEHGVAEFEVYEETDGECRWRLIDQNDTIIADSDEGYASKSTAEDTVEHIRECARDAPIRDIRTAVFEIYEEGEADSGWRWRLRHHNGESIAIASEGYTTRSGAEDSVNQVKRNAPEAEIEAVQG